jgi:hypothetical protein
VENRINVRNRLRLIELTFLFSVVVISSIIVTRQAWAGDRNSEHVTFSASTMVTGTLLEPGTYNVVWEGTGPHVQVTFEKGLKTVLITGAEVISETSPYDGAIVIRTREDKTQFLQKIRWRNKALVFTNWSD